MRGAARGVACSGGESDAQYSRSAVTWFDKEGKVASEMETLTKEHGIASFKFFLAYKGVMMVSDEEVRSARVVANRVTQHAPLCSSSKASRRARSSARWRRCTRRTAT